MIDISEIQKGDCFSETSYYSFLEKNKGGLLMKHMGTGKEVLLSEEYVQHMLFSSDIYETELEVGIEDKLWTQAQIDKDKPTGVKVGDVRVPGIKTVWDRIGDKVFACEFTKKDTPLSKKAFDALVQSKMDEIGNKVDNAQKNKKSVSTVAKEIALKLINNPILNYIPGESRVMGAYKLQHNSVDGHYAVMDMDKGEKRVVNAATLNWIVVDGVKYIKK